MVRPHFLATALSAMSAFALAGAAAAAEPTAAEILAQRRPGQRLVAFAVTDGANVMDFSGPWETFQDVVLPGTQDVSAFIPYHVGDAAVPIEATGGMRVVPRYSFANAPRPDVIVVGAQKGSPGLTAWLREQAGSAEVIMSVCTGAFRVADAGLFDGKSATTHHDFYDAFEKRFPKVTLVRGPRFVDQGRVCSAGGLTSGIDLALHIVDRLHGKATADATAAYLEFVRTARPGTSASVR